MRDTYWSRIGISSRDSRELNTASARLLLDLMPGLETSVVFHDTEGLINRLFVWAEKGQEPLQTYSSGLLAAAMELQDLAANYREQNAHLVPIMLKRLWEIQKKSSEESASSTENNHTRRFPSFQTETPTATVKVCKPSTKNKGWIVTDIRSNNDADAELMPGPSTGDSMSEKIKASKNRLQKKFQTKLKNNQDLKSGNSSLNGSLLNDSSNSSWAEMESYVIGIS